MGKVEGERLGFYFLCDGLSTIIPIRRWLCVFLLGCPLSWMMGWYLYEGSVMGMEVEEREEQNGGEE